ncbi:MAG: dimethylamine monooxygenase subunit DmmA family protein [Pseudomonadota bacterium]
MSKFAFPPSIRSRPVYGELSPVAADRHLMIADAEGAEALIDLARRDPALIRKAHVIFIQKSTGGKYVDDLKSLQPEQLYIGPTYGAALQRIQHVLSELHMGAQLYLAGTEGLIGQAMNEATQAGIPHMSIQTEHRGSTARRVQCVHCKGVTEDVATDPYKCSHCGLNLFVRDHYSRRHAAFQGVRIDAEDHGNVPKAKGLYS